MNEALSKVSEKVRRSPLTGEEALASFLSEEAVQFFTADLEVWQRLLARTSSAGSPWGAR